MNHRHATTADHLLGSRTRVRLLGVLLFPPEGRMWVRELCRRVGTGASGIQRELLWLRSAGLVRMRREGGAAYYEVIEGHPLIGGLRQLLESAESMDENGGRWLPPIEETIELNRSRYREHQRRYLEREDVRSAGSPQETQL
jgi:DNA-binding transcriptional ArsR family regulator